MNGEITAASMCMPNDGTDWETVQIEDGPAGQSQNGGGRIALSVPDRVMLLKLTPRESALLPAPAPAGSGPASSGSTDLEPGPVSFAMNAYSQGVNTREYAELSYLSPA